MFCSLDDAYNTASDLLQEKHDCVYDNIMKEDTDIIEQCRPNNMFTTQGEFKQYDGISEFNEIQKSHTEQNEYPNELGGTPIDTLIQKKQSDKNYAPVQKKKKQNDIDYDEIPEYSIPNKNSLKNKEKVTMTADDEDKIRHIVKESFHDIIAKNNQTNNKLTNKINTMLSSYIGDGMIITFIGILILFLLDILVRISKKL